VRQRVTVSPTERVGAELGRVGDGREVDDLPAATVLESPVLLQPAAREIIGMPPGLDRDDRVAVGLETLQGGRRPPVVDAVAHLLRLGLGRSLCGSSTTSRFTGKPVREPPSGTERTPPPWFVS
jgi:hypothetical protein